MAAYSADIIIVGGGIMGCAAAYHLAKEGQQVLLLEQFTIGNRYGSSHGGSRLFRLFHEEVDDVQLARAAYLAWRDLETDSGEHVLHQVNGLDFGSPAVLSGFHATLQSAGVYFDLLDHDEMRYRFPYFNLPENTVGYYQTDYGLFSTDHCVATLAAQVRRYGATIIEGQAVSHIYPLGDSVQLTTDKDSFKAGRLILSAGSWMRPLVRQLDLDLPLIVRKELLTYYRPSDPAAFMPDRFPVFRHHQPEPAARWGVGFPIFAHAGVKMVLDCTGPVIDPNDTDRAVDQANLERVRAYTARIMPALGDDVIETDTCRYTMTPDEHFIIDRHPLYPQIILASPCSGHGFKFAILIGKILADLAMRGETGYNLERFRLARPSLSGVTQMGEI